MYLFALTYFWADEVFALDREISCNYYMVYRTYVSCNHYRIIWSQGKPLNQCFGLQCTATRTWHWQSFPLLLNHSCTYSKAIANYKVKMDEKFTDFQVTPYPSFTPSCIIGLLSSLHVGFKSWIFSSKFILNRKCLGNLPMKEKYLVRIWAIDDLRGTFRGVRLMFAKTAKKAENHSKEVPINIHLPIGKSRLLQYKCSLSY